MIIYIKYDREKSIYEAIREARTFKTEKEMLLKLSEEESNKGYELHTELYSAEGDKRVGWEWVGAVMKENEDGKSPVGYFTSKKDQGEESFQELLDEGMRLLNINGLQWQIRMVACNDPLLMFEGEVLRGACWCSNQVIALSDALDKRIGFRTLVHELTHAYIWSTQCGGLHLDEEFFCDFMAVYGEQILRDARRQAGEIWRDAE